MNKYFSDWHREVSIDVSAIPLDARWGVVESIVGSASAADVIQLVRLATQMEPALDYVEKFAAAFKEQESTFSMRNNERELAVLAGACVFTLFDSGNPAAQQVAHLATEVAALAGWQFVVADVATDSGRRLEMAARDGRQMKRPVAPPSLPATTPKQPDETAITSEMLTAAAKRADNATSKLAAWADVSFAAFVDNQRADREELDVLWWTFTEASIAGVAWPSMSGGLGALVGGSDLREMTSFGLIVPNARAFLGRAVAQTSNPNDAVSVSSSAGEYVKIAPERAAAITSEQRELCPVSRSVKAAADGLTASDGLTLAPDELAYRWYLECRLIDILDGNAPTVSGQAASKRV